MRRLWLAEGLDPSNQIAEIERLAERRRIRIERVRRTRLESQAQTDSPQGVLAVAAPVHPVDLEDLCKGADAALSTGEHSSSRPSPFLVVVSGVTDPRNLGAMLRSAECSGVSGIVLSRHRSAHLSPAAVKTASGAVEHLDFSLVGGIPAALEQMRRLGVWIVGLAGDAPRSLHDLPLGTGPVALVLGGEERGLAPLVRRRCDEVVSIPQFGKLPSLNVAAAGAVACFEVARQRARA